MIKIAQKLKDQLWWLIISVDYDYSRIAIADHDLTDETLTLWLEDKHDFKNSLDECLQLDIKAREFAKIIKAENFNSYEGSKMHPTKNFVYKARIEINAPLKWYQEDAVVIEQQWAREAVLKTILAQLVETEAACTYE
ncbi:hypothetical protein SNE25_13415 [Mucilaginibacter sabulilitoris]|uniref:Uncharacterized protein n=1 Tax=Mucilaginibacter sabulilitoris TaxID=1173583 RepID=A0ABZ0TVL0_9SPHI|nr:hypothetical protein [Mucilaginibacter sabulilitoris]WPU96517.1 hypothetical protein SNE25_13415 [Mucilaginibacter sabulilitoris]